jgi:hypothetical protein
MPRIGYGKSIEVTAPAGGAVAGDFYSVNGIFGMALNTVDAFQPVNLDIEANARYSVLTSPVMVPLNAVVYFDRVTQDFTIGDTLDSVPVGLCDNGSSGVGNAFTFTRYNFKDVI